jgi:hypothetical protein
MAELIYQRDTSDCAIAAIAMATGFTYEEVLHAAADDYTPGKGTFGSYKVLERLGFRYSFKNGRPVGDIVSRHKDYSLAPECFRDMAWGRPALFSVPSLNIPDGTHMVYYDGYEVYDPNPPSRKRYTNFDELMPTNVILFRPNLPRSGPEEEDA